MKKFGKEIKIAIIVLTSIGLFYYGFNFLKGESIFDEKRQYYALYDNISNLEADNPVVLNGFKVGKVNMVEMLHDNSGRLIVGFNITESHLKIPRNTSAEITSLDLLGSKAIALKIGDALEEAIIGDTINSAIEEDLKSVVDRRIQPLEEKTKELISSIDSAVTIVQLILNKDARESLSESFLSIKRALRSLENTAFSLDQMMISEKDKIDRIFTNVEAITSNFRSNNHYLNNIISNFSTISDSIAKTDITTAISSANKALSDVSELIDKINSGQGTMGQLVNNDTLYYNLENASNELDLLFEDMRVNPKRYVHFSVFGKKDKDKPEKRPRE